MLENFKDPSRTLMYEPGFREWMREHPGALNAVRDVVKTLETLPDDKLGDKMNFDIGAIEIELHGGGEFIDKDFRYYYLKASVQDDQFFIKVQTHKATRSEGLKEPGTFISDGADEFKSTLSAKERLAGIDWVEVVEPLFGYHETVNERKQSYFVSKWRDLPKVYKVLREFSEQKDPKFEELRGRVEELKKLLHGFFDVETGNMFYDAETDKIVLYDLSKL